jgi:hypothetical protein
VATQTDPRRAETYVGSPGIYLLNQACAAVAPAFDTTPFLVGSALESKVRRDIDVRVIIPDSRYKELFPGIGDNPRTHALWSLLCSGTALWLGQASGLPVDFQVQSQSRADLEVGRRVALGVFPTGGQR